MSMTICLDCGVRYDDVKQVDECPHQDFLVRCAECAAVGNHSDWCSKSVTRVPVLGRWVNEALCGGLDPQDFFERGFVPDAYACCRACPVRRQCAEYAIEARVDHGMWAGTGPTERRRIRNGALTVEEAFGG